MLADSRVNVKALEITKSTHRNSQDLFSFDPIIKNLNICTYTPKVYAGIMNPRVGRAQMLCNMGKRNKCVTRPGRAHFSSHVYGCNVHESNKKKTNHLLAFNIFNMQKTGIN